MRLLAGIAFLMIFQACSQNQEKAQTVSDQIRISLDTVLVDSGEEFLFLQDQLYSSSLSEDKNYLFNFNPQNFIVEKIDLNQLKLEKRIQFEKEGPNGLSLNYPRFSILPGNNFLFWTYHFYKIFDQNSLMIKDMELDKISAEYLGNTEYYPGTLFQDKNNSNRLIAFIFHGESGSLLILDFDLKDQTFEKIELPELEKLNDFRVKLLYEGTPAGDYGPRVYTLNINGQIIISNTAFNEVQIFDLEKDSLYMKSWNTHLLADKKSYVPPKEAERTSDQLREIIKKTEEDLNYRSFFWDQKNERYFRFSEKKHFAEELTDFGTSSTGADVFLSVFDMDLNLIAEAQIPELPHSIGVHFVKDGKIWMYENIDDELAFVIMDVEVL